MILPSVRVQPENAAAAVPAVIHLITDLEDQRWLRYILEEFNRIQGLEAEWRISDIHEKDRGRQQPVIYYTKYYQGGDLALINRSHILPKNRIESIHGEKIYAVDNTTTTDEKFTLPYDLFWNAFVFLSRLEEALLLRRRKSALSHGVLHPREDKASLAVPIVNFLFNELEAALRKHFPALRFKPVPKPRIELSHDVDYLAKDFTLMVKQTALNAYDFFRFLRKGRGAVRAAGHAARFLFQRPSYWCFEHWEEVEKKFDYRSVFYIHARVLPKTPLTWVTDPTYDLARNLPLQQKLRQLVRDGFEVGIQGSFLSAVDGDLFRREKELLENVLGSPVTKGRQRWLRYDENKTPPIHNRYLKFDSTLGWNVRVGFRSGCASLYRPYDHQNQRPFDFWEIPQVIMDFNIYQPPGAENVPFEDRALRLIDQLEECRSAHVAVSWHQQACNADYPWGKTYDMILERIAGHRDLHEGTIHRP
ncbi:MAG: hypothetical protein Q8Q08_04630 [Candidatus Omnitrophota bacterium]|nr:hypothetical protein [Candidatus Omnitrophota bacterium]MDZ4241355.1 hypothetical protein [Candidatus Omnitrophota bacterium]